MSLNFPKNQPDGFIWYEPSNRVTYVYNRVKNSWTGVGLEAQNPSIEEAPLDNRMYARRDADWSDVEKTFSMDVLYSHSVAGKTYPPNYVQPTAGGVPEAPEDGLMYMRRDNSWIQLERNMDIRALPDLGAPKPFYEKAAGSTIDDAPNNGRNHCRKSGAWVVLEQEFDIDQYQEVS